MINFMKFSWINAVLILFLASSAAQAADNINELVLANGLKVIVKADHRSPSVVFQILYKVFLLFLDLTAPPFVSA